MSILDRFRLDGKVAIITGASSGFGVAFAEAFADAGADVVLVARRADKLEDTKKLVEAHRRRALVVPVDVTDADAADTIVDATIAEFGRLDILVNNAGYGLVVPAIRETREEFLGVMDIYLNACYWLAQSAARAMKDGGSILNVSSMAAIRSTGSPQAGYVASKAALVALTKELAQQWTGRLGIRVNAVLPGFFETELTEEWFKARFEEHRAKVPVGRGGHPDELAAAALFLVSDAGSYVTGEGLVVDGGRTLL
jgi:NAD(P)-dependent dehydrogenase (short-subunit alcohol dehydrogenase family)